jgi:hypothetical protein
MAERKAGETARTDSLDDETLSTGKNETKKSK